MARSWPLIDRWSDFSQNDLGGQASNTDDLIQAFDRALVGDHHLCNPLVERDNQLIEFVNMGQNLLQHEAMVGANETG